MKKLLKVLGLALLLTLGACGGGSSNPAIGGNSPTNGIGPSKPINSYWTMVDNNYDSSLNGFVLNLSSITGPGAWSLVYSTGCSSEITINGGQFSGTFSQTKFVNCGIAYNAVLSGLYNVSSYNELRLDISGGYIEIYK